ncbi:DNA-binding protein [Streptomyces sp. NRRL WC-3618]|nr:DNA-binding protein [Streptomyces sp. NRRL WC-3618]
MKVGEQWDVYLTSEVDHWLNDLEKADPASYVLVNQAIWILACHGPAEGRPLVDRIKGSSLHQLKELRPGSAGRSEVRVLFMFDPWRSAILLVAGDKAGNWNAWYDEAIPLAELRYAEYVADRKRELGQ